MRPKGEEREKQREGIGRVREGGRKRERRRDRKMINECVDMIREK